MHRTFCLLACAPLLLAGCAQKEAEWAMKGRTTLVGLDQSAIRMCAGLPTGTTKDGRSEIWMYEHTTSLPDGMAPFTVTLPIGLGFGGTTPSGYCRVQMRFLKGKVTEVQYAGATDILNARDAACGQIVRSCLDYGTPGRQAGSF